jgi:hypothetical protein
MIKSKILGENGVTVKDWKELQKHVRDKDIDYLEFCLAYTYLQRASPRIKGEPDFAPLEMLYRTLGVESEFSDAVFRSLAKADMRGPRSVGKAPDTKKLLAGLDGWKIRDRMNAMFKRVLDAVKSEKIEGELGEELLDGLLYGVNEYYAMWQKKTEDVSEQYSAPIGFEPYKDVAIENRHHRVRFQEPRPEDEANFPFRALLALLSSQAWDAMLELNAVWNIDIGRLDPEHIKIYKYGDRAQEREESRAPTWIDDEARKAETELRAKENIVAKGTIRTTIELNVGDSVRYVKTNGAGLRVEKAAKPQYTEAELASIKRANAEAARLSEELAKGRKRR